MFSAVIKYFLQHRSPKFSRVAMCKILTESHQETCVSMSFRSLEVCFSCCSSQLLRFLGFSSKLWLCPCIVQIIIFATEFIRSRIGTSRRAIEQTTHLSFFWVLQRSKEPLLSSLCHAFTFDSLFLTFADTGEWSSDVFHFKKVFKKEILEMSAFPTPFYCLQIN